MNATTSSYFPTFGKAARAALSFILSIPRKCLALLRWFRRLLFSRTSFKCYVVIATLVCLTYTTLRWIGRRAWQAENERAAAAGMVTDWKAFATPMPSEEDNFFAAPVFDGAFTESPYSSGKYTLWSKKLSMWFSKRTWATPRQRGTTRTTDVPRPKDGTLADWCEYFRQTGMLPTPSTKSSPAEELLADQRWQTTIQAFYSAAARPTAKFTTYQHTGMSLHTGTQMTSNLLFALLKSIQLYAEAQLEMNNLSEVLPALRVTDHFVQAYTAEPGYFSLLSAVGAIRTENALLKAGMKLHRWPSPLLESLLQTNYPELILQTSRRGFQYQRAVGCNRLQNFPESFFGSWGIDEYPYWWAGEYPYRSLLIKVLVPDYLPMLAAVRTSRHFERLYQASAPLLADESWQGRMGTLAAAPKLKLGPSQIFGNDVSGPGPAWEFGYFHIQPIVESSIRHLAIALELHYLAYGRYPATLAELSPRLAIPPWIMNDVDGQPIRYTADAAGSHFTLISVGVNGILNAPNHRHDDIVFSTDPAGKPK